MGHSFALTGVAGYIAPRHLQAIKDTGNTLVAALDPHDSVGILGRYFPDCAYFREPERFDRHIEKLRRDHEDERVRYWRFVVLIFCTTRTFAWHCVRARIKAACVEPMEL